MTRSFRRSALGALTCAGLLGGFSGPADAGVPAWTTYRHDAAGTGIDPDSGSPVPPNQLWQTAPLDDHVYGQPLVYGTRVYVATESDSVYALDAATGQVVWHSKVGTPVAASALSCGDIKPNVGITSTPVIDPATNRIYVVADTWDGSNPTSITHRLVGLNLAGGAQTVSRVVDPPGATPKDLLQRTGLALDRGEIVIGFGGNYGDCGKYHGWLVATHENGTGPMRTFEADPNTGGGAIWGSGNAPVIDTNGNIFAVTGNGINGSFGVPPTTYDGSQSIFRLDSRLSIRDSWAPSNWQSLDASDADLGSSEPLLLPQRLLFQNGKDGNGYLLRAAALGGVGAKPAATLGVCSRPTYGGAVYQSGTIYVSCSAGLRAVSIDPTTATLSLKAGWSAPSDAIGPPIIAGGLVWSVGWISSTLYGLDLTTGAVRFSTSLTFGSVHFSIPSAAGGRLFVANDRQVTALRISHPPAPSRSTTKLTSSADRSVPGHLVTFKATVLPSPLSGSVRFREGGTPIAGCSTIAIGSGHNTARCRTRFRHPGRYRITARYSGSPYVAGSRSAALSHLVVEARRRR